MFFSIASVPSLQIEHPSQFPVSHMWMNLCVVYPHLWIRMWNNDR